MAKLGFIALGINTALTGQLLQGATAKGYGDEGICGSIRVLEEYAGCEVKAEPAMAKA